MDHPWTMGIEYQLLNRKKVAEGKGFAHVGAGAGMQCTEPGQAASDTGGRGGGELVAHSVPTWNQIGAWLRELDQLRQGSPAQGITL